METRFVATTNSSDNSNFELNLRYYKFYVQQFFLFTDSENEDFDDSVKDKDQDEKENSELSSERSYSECDEILDNDINEQGIINVIINEVCESAILSYIAEAEELIPINKE